MQVKDAMAHTISVVSPNESIKRVAQLMRQEDAGFIPVCDNDRLLGVVTDRDIVIRCIADGHNVLDEPAEHCMTKAPVTVESVLVRYIPDTYPLSWDASSHCCGVSWPRA